MGIEAGRYSMVKIRDTVPGEERNIMRNEGRENKEEGYYKARARD